MTDDRIGLFLPTAHTGPAWDVINEQLERGPTKASTIDALTEELAVRELLARYTYTFDQGDLEGVLEFFTDDCVITGPRGTVSGREEIAMHYRDLIQNNRHRIHYLTSVVVRLSEGLRDGVVTAYHHAILEPHGDPPRIVGGVVADRVRKLDGSWRIAARSSSIDLEYEVIPIRH